MKKAAIATATAGIAVTAFAAPTIASASTIVVESGDTLWGIAEKNNTTVDTLKQLNKLASDKIFPGQKLIVGEQSKIKAEKEVSATWLNVRQGPGVENQIMTSLQGGTKVTVESTEDNGWSKINFGKKTGYVNSKYLAETTASTPKQVAKQEVKASTPKKVVKRETSQTQVKEDVSTYAVKSGDTLWGLSTKFGVPVQDLISWNNLSSSSIYVGQVLSIKASVQKAPVQAAPKQAVKQDKEVEQSKQTAPKQTKSAQQPIDTSASSYTVKSGDSLNKIASIFGISVSQLKALNHLSSDSLQVGQVLKVKGQVATPVQKQEQPAQKEQTNTQPKEDVKQTPSIDTNASSYTVKSGDSLSKIANIFGISVSNLKALNNLSSNALQVGQVLKVKGQATNPAQNMNNTNNNSTTSNTNNAKPDKPAQNTNNNNSSSTNNNSSSASSSSYAALLAEAQKHLGKSYSWGANGPSSFDCSGYTKYVFAAIGISLPRTSGGQYASSTSISESQAKPGDLVFFNYGRGISHVGIYVGGGQMINAQDNGVKYDNIHGSGWGQFLVGFGRVTNF
ncbi:LysM peptidoglycan-binding domain-containing protein [Listeria sp. PSOL-1]|uniref:LysM peptidoglycan-binding domain-containing protein n=1 Tax=Listeria sp. PSOL-1 TaxID=1844999 RepID=UPI0013D03B72|nr:LysM peptidoglycan-binding domain-containing protein [Listeria sp. PSOL-1]